MTNATFDSRTWTCKALAKRRDDHLVYGSRCDPPINAVRDLLGCKYPLDGLGPRIFGFSGGDRLLVCGPSRDDSAIEYEC